MLPGFLCHNFALLFPVYGSQGTHIMKKTGYFLLAVIVIVAAAGVGYWKFSGNPDALREIVLEQCLPDQLQHQNPAPCAEVKPRAGYVVFKDRHGPLQYLLMPTYRINGTESPLLLEPATPNFFWLARQARGYMSKNTGMIFRIARSRWRLIRGLVVHRTICISIFLASVLTFGNNWITISRASALAGFRCRVA